MEVTCPCGCKYTFEVDVRRHGQIGTGYYRANELKRLGRTHKQVLRIVDANHCIDWKSGLTKVDLTFKVNELRKTSGLSNIKGPTLSGYLSVLQGLGVLSCRPANVILADPETMQFKHDGTPRWYRSGHSLLEEQPDGR